MRKLATIMSILLISVLVSGCDLLNPDPSNNEETPELSEYELWLKSSDAIDVNEDSVINETDYNLYLLQNDFTEWLNSDAAVDGNGDRKIDEEDYELYLIENVYDYWLESDVKEDVNNDGNINQTDHELYLLYTVFYYWERSDEASDLNGDDIIDEIDHELYVNYDQWYSGDNASDVDDDGSIDIDDFELYLDFEEFIGTYTIEDYVYDGLASNEFSYNIDFVDLGDILTDVSFTVDNTGTLTANIPMSVQDTLEDHYELFEMALENLTISRISPFIVVLDTYVTVDNVDFNITFYLQDTEDGYSTTYVAGFYSDEPELSFTIIKGE